jgi:hypothetical protein
MSIPRTSCRYQSRRDDSVLRERLIELAREKPRFGYRRLHVLLRREGDRTNHKRVQRVYREAGLCVRRIRRKRLARTYTPRPLLTAPNQEWAIDFASDVIAGIAVTSEAEGAPVEAVFDSGSETGWRAGTSGLQVIRITFGEPKAIRRIQLEFRESQIERTQEFSLHATSAGSERTEIIRQQWTFSPQGSTQEVEDYRLNLNNISTLELTIDPDLSHGRAHASLLYLRIGPKSP